MGTGKADAPLVGKVPFGFFTGTVRHGSTDHHHLTRCPVDTPVCGV